MGVFFSLVRTKSWREPSIPLQTPWFLFSYSPCSTLFQGETHPHEDSVVDAAQKEAGVKALKTRPSSHLAVPLDSFGMGFGSHWFWHPFIHSFGGYIHKRLLNNAR